MQKVTKRMQRRALRGWKRWILVVVVAFSPLYVDAWLNIKMRHHDYLTNYLNSERQRLQEELVTLAVNRASLERLDRLSMSAEELGLREPEPAQVHVVYYDGAINSPASGQGRMVLARRTAQSEASHWAAYEEDGVARLVHNMMVRGATMFQRIENGLGNLLDAPTKVEASELVREAAGYPAADDLGWEMEFGGEGAPGAADAPYAVEVNGYGEQGADHPAAVAEALPQPGDAPVDTLPAPLDAILDMPREPAFNVDDARDDAAREVALDASLEDLLGSL